MSRRPASPAPDDEGFLGRWSRRKREAAHGDEPHDAPESRDGQMSPGETDGERPADEPVLTDADMPDIDSIDDTSSVAEFFSPGVSEALRRKALRKLFHSSKFNVRDGLDDFDDDYTHFEKLGDVVTSDMKHRMELEAEKLRERQLAALEADADDVPAADEPPAADDDEQDGASAGNGGDADGTGTPGDDDTSRTS